MQDDFFVDSDTHVTKTVKPGKPGTLNKMKNNSFTGKLVKVRYYKNERTNEQRKTVEIEEDK